jgi:hypothetical protein
MNHWCERPEGESLVLRKAPRLGPTELFAVPFVHVLLGDLADAREGHPARRARS